MNPRKGTGWASKGIPSRHGPVAPGERLGPAPERQKRPKIPLNIIRHPLTLVPPMVPVKDNPEYEDGDGFAQGGVVEDRGDDRVPALLDNSFVLPRSGMDRLLDAVAGVDTTEEEDDVGDEEQGAQAQPHEGYCLSCGYADLDGTRKICPDCGDELYAPTEP